MIVNRDRLAGLLLLTIEDTVDVANLTHTSDGYRFTHIDGNLHGLTARSVTHRHNRDGTITATFAPDAIAAVTALDIIANIFRPSTHIDIAVYVRWPHPGVVTVTTSPNDGVQVIITDSTYRATFGTATVTATRTATGYQTPMFATTTKAVAA